MILLESVRIYNKYSTLFTLFTTALAFFILLVQIYLSLCVYLGKTIFPKKPSTIQANGEEKSKLLSFYRSNSPRTIVSSISSTMTFGCTQKKDRDSHRRLTHILFTSKEFFHSVLSYSKRKEKRRRRRRRSENK